MGSVHTSPLQNSLVILTLPSIIRLLHISAMNSHSITTLRALLVIAHNALPPETSGPHSSAATTPAAQVPRSAALTPVCSTTPASQPYPSMDRQQRLPLHWY